MAAITRTPLVDDDGSGTTGTILNNAWQTNLYNAIDAAIAGIGGGAIVDVPFNAADYFTADAGATFVVGAGQPTYFYTVNNKVVTVSLQIAAATITGNPTYLMIRLPAGTIAARSGGVAFPYFIGGVVQGTGFARVNQGEDVVRCLRDVLGTSWTPTSTLYLYMQFFYTLP
jgi:hypothetical protein